MTKPVDLALLCSRRQEDLLSYAQDLGASSLHVRKRLINKKLLFQAREQQLPVRIYTVNRSVQLYQLIRKDIAGIITDVPDRAFAIRKLVK